MKNKEQEIWKDVVGYEGYYQVSNFGGVRSLSRKIKSTLNNQSIGHKNGIQLKLGTTHGYNYAHLCVSHKISACRVHRLVAQAFIPNPENKPCVNHKNGIKNDNRVENLEWVTNKENQLHMTRVLGKNTGMNHWHTKLTIETANKIRESYLVHKSQRKVAALFSVSKTCVAGIINNKTYIV